jgi:tetratricopeptide (TPR) repeat protein
MDDALKSYQRATYLQPNLAEAQEAIGDIYVEQKDPLSAIIAYRQYAYLAPNNPEAHYKLGKALKDRDRVPEAISAFEQAKRLYQQQGKSDKVQEIEKMLRDLKKNDKSD